MSKTNSLKCEYLQQNPSSIIFYLLQDGSIFSIHFYITLAYLILFVINTIIYIYNYKYTYNLYLYL